MNKEAKITAKAKAELANKTFAGYGVTFVHEMDDKQFIDWACGHVLIEIGAGNFRGGMITVTSLCRSRHEYWNALKALEDKLQH